MFVVREGGDEHLLHFVPDERGGESLEKLAQGVRCGLTIGRDDASIRSGDGQGQRRAAPRTVVIREERDANGRLRRQPGLQVADLLGAADLDPAWVEDGRRERRRQILGDHGPVRIGSPFRDASSDPTGPWRPPTALKSSRSCNSPLSGLVPEREGPQPSGRPATRAAGT